MIVYQPFRTISIQALYDYKLICILYKENLTVISIQALYDYKVCIQIALLIVQRISIQALYDYKKRASLVWEAPFLYFNSSIVRL